jgi:voltage-gated sodium channel
MEADAMRERIRQIIETRGWEQAVIALIVVNAAILGLETDAGIMAQFGRVLEIADRIVLALFVVEIALRIFVYRTAFLRDPWSIFDFTVVALALIPATGPLQVLRALRILRVLRLLSIMPSLRRVVGGLFAALPGMASIMLLIGLVFYVFAVMATNLFGPAFPEWFGSLDASAYTLFQMMTLDSWSSGIVRPIMEIYPFAWAFFVPFVLVTTYAVLNLFIGVIVSAMQSGADTAHAEAAQAREVEILSELRQLRAEIAQMRAGRQD